MRIRPYVRRLSNAGGQRRPTASVASPAGLPAVALTEGRHEFTEAAALFTVALALTHLLAGRWTTGRRARHRRTLSAAGGAAVAYVFVLLLPEVGDAALAVGRTRGEAFPAEQLVYVGALAGFVAFYGVEVFVTQYRGETAADAPLVFRFHLGTFGLYSALVGYLLFHQEVAELANLALYAVAMALHFGVTDYGLRRHHGAAFDRRGRWLLAVATAVGGIVGALTDLGGLALSVVFGFLAGATVLNVVKEELPQVDESRFAAFAGGALASTAILLFL